MRVFAVVAGLLFAFALAAWSPAEAWAQNVSVNNVKRSKATHTQPNTFWVSRADCEGGDVFDFPFTIQSPSSVLSFQVWIGEGSIDCKTYDARSGVAGGQCVQLLADGAPKQLGNVELSSAEIAAALSGVEGCDDTSGNYNARDVTIYFLLIRTVGEDIGAEDAFQWTETKVDMLGPPAPTDVVAKIGDGTVIAEFEPRSDNDIRGYRLYCDEGTASGAGGGGAGGGSTGDCAGGLVAGEVPPSDKQCGSVTGVASTISASRELDNGTSYQIGVAAYDLLGNAGPLSTTSCVTPAPVDDFYSTYRRAGGEAGGGCAVAPSHPERARWGLGVLAVTALGAYGRRRARNARRALAAAALALPLAALLAPTTASAQEKLHDTDWRRTNRPSPPHPDAQFAFELRFAPYWPQVDDEFGTSPGPYEQVFNANPQFYFGLEADWMPVRVPYVGMFGLGFGWGYTSTSTTARVAGCETPDDLATGESDPCLSGDETSLSIMPMHLSAVLRADGLMRETDIPLVPYGKLGIGLGAWSAGQTSGTSVVDGVEGSDTTWGIHTALGLMLSLNWIEPRSSSRLYETAGIAHAYAFAEWMNTMLNGLGSRPQMHVGTSTVVGGLAVDF